MNSQSLKPHINIIMLGHTGHGKTTLSRAMLRYQALTSKYPVFDFESQAEEKTAGITIGPPDWRREFETETRHYTLSDLVYPESYLGALVIGSAQNEVAILLVSASEGVMPQTREHVLRARRIGIPKLVVFINKTDLVKDAPSIARIETEVRALLDQFNFDGAQTPIIKGAALQGLHEEAAGMEAIAALIRAIDQHIPDGVKSRDGPFLMPIEDTFSVTGRGTLATGRIEQGIINPGDPVEIIGMMKEGEKPLTTVVQGIQMFRKILDRGEAGDNVGLFLNDIDKEAIQRGMVICQPGSVNSHKVIACEAYLLGSGEGGHPPQPVNGDRLHFSFRTASVGGQLAALQEVDTALTMLSGSLVCFEVTLDRAIAVETSLPFGMRKEGRNIGSGRVTQILQ